MHLDRHRGGDGGSGDRDFPEQGHAAADLHTLQQGAKLSPGFIMYPLVVKFTVCELENDHRHSGHTR